VITKRPNSVHPSRLARTPRRGSAQVSEVQRARMLSSAAAVVSEHGYGQMSVARVTAGARVSRRTFYDVFEDREDCFLALFDDALSRLSESVVSAYEREKSWREKVRAGLVTLLVCLDEQPEVASLLVMDALQAGPRVLQRRAEILGRLGMVLDRGGWKAKSAKGLPELTGEGVVGAVFSVIHTRLLADYAGSLVELLNPLMGMIVLPYQGSAAARRELDRPVPKMSRASGKSRMDAAAAVSVAKDPLEGLNMRLTYRTLRVLTVIAEEPGASNRTVGEAAGINDQGQISKLLQRLECLELVLSTTPGNRTQPTGDPNAWHLTPRGEEVQQVTRVGAADGNRDGVA
jgi:AcrR family transcriptional regulator